MKTKWEPKVGDRVAVYTAVSSGRKGTIVHVDNDECYPFDVKWDEELPGDDGTFPAARSELKRLVKKPKPMKKLKPADLVNEIGTYIVALSLATEELHRLWLAAATSKTSQETAD